MEKIVSIVFSTYNSSSYVKKCIDSCINQNYNSLYIIVADDGSTDNTKEIIENYSLEYKNIYSIPLPHGERGIARAKAIEKARELNSDFIYIMDSDMILKENLLKDCLNYIYENPKVGALVIPELSFSDFKNYYSKVKVFERKVINNCGEDLGKNSVEAARFWVFKEYESTGGININQIAFEETQPTIRYIEKGGIIKRALFTGVYHDEKYVTLKNILSKKKYYFSQMNKTLKSEENGNSKAFSRWYFFRPVLYRKDNLKEYLKHPLLTIGMIHMYFSLTFIGIMEIIKSKIKNRD